MRNKSALVIGICTNFTYFQTLRLRKRGFLHETGFSFPHRYHFDGRSSSESEEPRLRLLEIEAKAVIYIHPGIWRREPRLVTYATEISLLRSLVASQQRSLEASQQLLFVKTLLNFSVVFYVEFRLF